MKNKINIDDFAYDLPNERIAKYPLTQRDGSKLLVYNSQHEIVDEAFRSLAEFLSSDALMVFNNTKVVRARLIFHKPTGARIEIFCLEPCDPPAYEQAFAAKGQATWHCIVGNAKKFNCPLVIEGGLLTAERGQGDVVHFRWTGELTFGQLLEQLGRMPIPPYLNRESEAMDLVRYQTTYATVEGSVAAPTAGLHFTPEVLRSIQERGIKSTQVTLHVGAGTFLPVKESDARQHVMHNEHFVVTIEALRAMAEAQGRIIAVGTTSLRTLESLAVLSGRVAATGRLDAERAVGQWEEYGQKSLMPLLQYMQENGLSSIASSTQIMITPGFQLATIAGMVTNFHQPKSTLLLLIAAIVGDDWRAIYEHALGCGYRFLSYGDSSLLMRR
ncbi:MAG: S-adenosylmethionine:tRNA ribosyltransferase-isomerase [Mucinivorans sp.]